MTDMDSPIYTNGVIRVCVPSGWKLFKGIDSGGKETSDKVHIYKNIDLKTDLFRKAGITIKQLFFVMVQMIPKRQRVKMFCCYVHRAESSHFLLYNYCIMLLHRGSVRQANT